MNALAAAAQTGAHRAIYLTAAMTGLRQGECCGLRWQDVDWTAAKLRVRQNHVLGETSTPKSKRSTRAVPLGDAVAGELDRLFKASSRQSDDDLVFADPVTGAPLDKAAILRRYRKALKAAKLDEAHRFHDLRHTFGTLSDIGVVRPPTEQLTVDEARWIEEVAVPELRAAWQEHLRTERKPGWL